MNFRKFHQDYDQFFCCKKVGQTILQANESECKSRLEWVLIDLINLLIVCSAAFFVHWTEFGEHGAHHANARKNDLSSPNGNETECSFKLSANPTNNGWDALFLRQTL